MNDCNHVVSNANKSFAVTGGYDLAVADFNEDAKPDLGLFRQQQPVVVRHP